MLDKEKIILVTGATSSQGGAVANALLKYGNTVRIIVREASRQSEQAITLANAGAEVVVADIDDQASLEKALKGTYGLFSVQAMDDGSGSETRHADKLSAAAFKMNVQHVVHVSVSELDNIENFPGWGEGKWNEKYWNDKRHAENAFRNAGFKYLTVLRPTFFMDNFIPPKAGFMYPGLKDGKIIVVFNREKKLQFVAAEDTGRFATAAFNNVKDFDNKTIELAGDESTMEGITEQIGKVTGKKIEVVHVSEKEGVENGMYGALANYQEWTNVAGYKVNIKSLEDYGITLTTFAQYFNTNRQLINEVVKDLPDQS